MSPTPATPTHPVPPRQRAEQQPAASPRPPVAPLSRAVGRPTPYVRQQPPPAPPRQRTSDQPTHPVVEAPLSAAAAAAPAHPPAHPATPAPAAAAQPSATPSAPQPPAPRWADPTIQVRQIEPLLAEEAARIAATGPSGSTRTTDGPGRSGAIPTTPGAAPSRPVSGPPLHHAVAATPTAPQPVSAPPVHVGPASAPAVGPSHPVSAPPDHGQPVSGPPDQPHPASGPPAAHAQPVSGPPGYGPPGYGPPVSAPPVSAPPWGLTAPPWSSSAPPHPLPTAGGDPKDPSRTDTAETTPDSEATPSSATTMDGQSTAGGESMLVASATMSTVQGEPSGFASASTEVFPAVGPAPAPPQDTTAASLTPVTYGPPATLTHPPAAQYPSGQQYPGQPYQQSHEVYPGQRYQQDTYSAAYADESVSAGRSRATLIGAAVAAGVALVAVAGLGAVVLNRDDAPPPTGGAVTAAPAVTGPPPGDLKLRDDVVTITLTWTDPSGGAVPFMVAGGRAGLALGVMATVEPGRTSHTVNGLSSRVDYCFTVLAVYSTASFATSSQVCTNRERSTPPS